MGLADRLFGGVTHGLEKVVIGAQHDAIEVELNDRHRAIDRFEQAGLFGEGALKIVDDGFVAIKEHVRSTQEVGKIEDSVPISAPADRMRGRHSAMTPQCQYSLAGRWLLIQNFINLYKRVIICNFV
ncbi:hypothetical protein D3C81_1716130 [compost metagenome]